MEYADIAKQYATRITLYHGRSAGDYRLSMYVMNV